MGTLTKAQRINTDGVKLHTRGPVEVSTFTVTLAPRGFTGWHQHPGLLLATVQAGAVVRQVGCRSRKYRVGETFTEHGRERTGQVTNPSTTETASFSVTQIAPPGTPRRHETAPPEC